MLVHARRTVLGGASALVLLLLAAPSPTSAVEQLRGAGTAVDPAAPLVAAVALLAWALTLWLVTTAVLVVAAQAPGVAGRAAAAVGRRLAPTVVRRALELALGITVTVAGTAVPAVAALPAPAASGAAVSGAASATAASAAPAAPAVPDLDWPVLSSSASPAPAAPPPSRPAAAPRAAAPVAAPPVVPRAAAPGAASARPAEARTSTSGPAWPSSARADGAVVVAPGDSLWELAEAHLARTGGVAPTDAQVAAAWPQWWAANREVVGDDPDLIRPGALLQPPAP